MLTHPTLDQLHALGLHGMAKGFKELDDNPETRARWRIGEGARLVRATRSVSGVRIGTGGRLHIGMHGRLRRNPHRSVEMRLDDVKTGG
jgi:hypothetical protein